MNKSDIIIIGAGPGGYRAAEYAAKCGLSVTIFESDRLGGTCLNAGCIPTKCFAHDAELLLALNELNLFDADKILNDIDFEKIVKRKDEVVSGLRNGIDTILSHPNIKLVHSHASFKDQHTVISGNEEYCADNIIIATGSKSKRLNIPVSDNNLILDSSDLLDLKTLPKNLCIIGAGVIGMEFASIFNAFGIDVIVVEFLKECLPVLDSDISKRLRKSLEKRGVVFHLQSKVSEISDKGVLFVNKKGNNEFVEAEKVLMAVGRVPNYDGLGLEKLQFSPEFLEVEPDTLRLKSSSTLLFDNIYAIGDVNGINMLAHVAEMQAVHVVNQILGKEDSIRLDIVPAAVFTKPEAACVGYSEDQCKLNGIEYSCKKAFWRANGKALAMNESEGMLKLISDIDGKIIGCHAYGAHSADIIQEVSVLMCNNTTIAQLSDMIHIHPTLSEILKSAVD